MVWLIEHLLPKNPAKFKGCEVVLPDTAIFDRDQCKYIVRNDRDFCLIQITNRNKTSLNAIYKDFTKILIDRRNDNNGVFSQLYH